MHKCCFWQKKQRNELAIKKGYLLLADCEIWGAAESGCANSPEKLSSGRSLSRCANGLTARHETGPKEEDMEELVASRPMEALDCSSAEEEAGWLTAPTPPHTLRKGLKLRTRLFSHRTHSPLPVPLLCTEEEVCCLMETVLPALGTLAVTVKGCRLDARAE